MKKRRLWITLAIASLALIGIWALWFSSHTNPWPSRANFEQVRIGMTRAEVLATVGAPPGVYPRDLHYSPFSISGSEFVLREDGEVYHDPELWFCSEGLLIVDYDADRVSDIKIRELLVFPRESILDRLRKWIGLD